jgi:hypothetical protein
MQVLGATLAEILPDMLEEKEDAKSEYSSSDSPPSKRP